MSEAFLNGREKNIVSVYLISVYINVIFCLFPGHTGNSSIHQNLELVVREHVLPHDYREPRARLQVALRDVSGLQDGRPAHLLHLPDAHQHEQTEVHASKINGTA